MIINSLNIYGFGKLENFTIELDKGINIIEGKNEAGKSTIMAFIRAILFGFEGRKNLHERYEPLHGGKFGGIIRLTDEKGRIYQIERIYRQKVAGDVQITMPDGELVGEEYLPTILGKINANIFKQIFSFGLTELQQIDLLEDNQINDFIYHAGTGSVNQILKMKQVLDAKKQELFRAGGKKPAINELLIKLDTITASIRKLKEKNSNHDSYLEQITSLENEINDYEAKSEAIKRELNKLRILERSYESYKSKERIDIELAEYPEEFVFPENGVERINTVIDKIDELRIESDQLAEKLESIKDDLIELPDAELYENNKDLIIAVKDQLNTYLEQVKKEQTLNIELQKNIESITENKRQIGSDYTEEKIRAIEITIQDKQYLQEQANLLNEKQRTLEKLDNDIEQNNKSSYRIKSIIKGMNKEDQRQEESVGKKISLLSFFIINGLALIGAALLVYFADAWMYGGILFGTILVLSLFFMIYNNKIIKLKEDMFHQGDQKRINEYQKELKDIQIDIELIEEKMNKVIEETREIKDSLDYWLVKKGLSTNMSIDILNNLIAIIQKSKELYIAKDGFAAQIKNVNNYREDFHNKVANLVAIESKGSDSYPAYKVEDKVNHFAERLKFFDEGKIANSLNIKSIEETNERIKNNLKLMEVENQKYTDLLAYVDVTDIEDFYKLERKYKQYTELIEERKQLVLTIQNNCHTEYNYEQMLEELATTNSDELTDKIQELTLELKGIAETIKNSSEEKGEIQNQVKELETDSMLSVQNQEYDNHATELKNKVKEWTALTINKDILEKTMNIYEVEKQPLLIQGASKIFSKMTGNEYINIVASIGTNELRVVRKDGQQFEPQYLSRGTVEQLFLAVRYALVEEYSKQNMLPIILDDIFVNFDSERLNNTIKAFESLGKKHQIIIFTCHKHVSKQVKEVIKDLKQVNLS